MNSLLKITIDKNENIDTLYILILKSLFTQRTCKSMFPFSLICLPSISLGLKVHLKRNELTNQVIFYQIMFII